VKVEFQGAVLSRTVSERFGGYAALRSVCFAVLLRSILGLIGLKDAGKTTLIKSLMDFSFHRRRHGTAIAHRRRHSGCGRF
jgi:ABC-type branched-subunit amino acid transport system ATPase component